MGLNGSDIELGERNRYYRHTMVCNLNLSPLVPFSRQLYQSVLPPFIFYSSIGVGREKCFLKGRTDRGQEVPSFHSCATHTEMNYCFLTSIKSFSFSCLLRKQSSPSFSTTVVVKWFLRWSDPVTSFLQWINKKCVPISSRTFFSNEGDFLYNPFGGRFNIRLDYYYVGGFRIDTLTYLSLCG